MYLFFNNLVVFGSRKDPEGLFGPPNTGHIARREFQRRLEKDADAREAFESEILQEKQRRQKLRDVILITYSTQYAFRLFVWISLFAELQ